jgi:ABC-2 type transport system permease protein
MNAWWRGTRLVAERSIVENVRSRTFRVVTSLLLLLSVAAVTLPQIFGQDETTYTLGTVGTAPVDLVAALDAAGDTAGFTIEYDARDDEDAVRQSVRDGDATAGLAGDTLYTSTEADGTFPVLVAQTVVSLETSRRMTDMGLTTEQVGELQSVQPPEQLTVGPVQDEGRASIGFAVGIALYLAITFAGSAIATTVATEKSTRISEVLLAVLRPSQALVGTVLAVGTATLAQLLVLAAPIAVAVTVTDDIGIPAVAAGDIALAVVWFILGFGLYAFAFAATAALVNKITEVSAAIMPVTITLIGGYLLAIMIVLSDPHGGWSVAASIFPFTAPMAMPLRWAAGGVPVYQLLLAMTLTAATAVMLAAVASSIYRRALLITGRRVKLREVLRISASASAPGRMSG